MANKKIVPSREALQAKSLKIGAKITSKTGKQFNANKEKYTEGMPAKKKRQPAPGPDKGAELIANQIEAGNKATAMMMAEIVRQIAEIKLSTPEPITEWVIAQVQEQTSRHTR